jgi:hypothetical protein
MERGGELQILMNVLVVDVPMWVSSDVKTLGLHHLQFPDIDAGGIPLHMACIVHLKRNELLTKRSTIAE